MQQKWYQKQRNIILLLIFLWPLGLVLMWKYTTWSKILKAILTVVIAFVGTAFITGLVTSGNKVDNDAINKAYWERKVADCRRKSTQNEITYAYGSWVNELNTTAITIHADLAEKVIPEVYIDGVQVDFNSQAKAGSPTIESAYDCKDTGSIYYSFSAKVPSTCTEKEVKLKTDKYELTQDVDNKNYGCKTKDQKDKKTTETTKQQSTKQSDIDTLSTELANTAISKRFSDSRQCLVEHTADSTKFSGDKALAKNATVLFVETGKKVFADQNCGEFVFYYNASTESNEPTRIATFSVYKETFNAYDWDTLKGKAVGVQLEQDEVLGIPATKNLQPKDFIY